jgi:hypothetical protein
VSLCAVISFVWNAFCRFTFFEEKTIFIFVMSRKATDKCAGYLLGKFLDVTIFEALGSEKNPRGETLTNSY